MTISASGTVPAGETVTIDPGATINMASGVTITVNGTLTASSATTHAKLTGSSWTGLVVASGGQLNLDGVDISGATTAIDVQGGTAEYDDGTITAGTPCNVATGASFTTKKSTFSAVAGTCNVAGSFTASYLTYTGGGSGLFDGIVTNDPTAQLSIEDSTFSGPGPNGPLHDMLVAGSGAAKFHVAYSSIKDVHCGFHFGTLSEFDISYIDDDSNAYGFMLYGSGGAGPFTVSYSNIDDNGPNGTITYATAGMNGPITFDHDYLNGTASDLTQSVMTTNPSNTTVTGTGPR
jgi:hypothetical protein